jgi:hypothetical protein
MLRSDHEAGLKLGQVVGCLVLRQLASICGGNFELCRPVAPAASQCDCSERVICPNDEPPPCDKLKELAKQCQESCPPCGTSFDRLPDPCSPAPQPDGATAEQLDTRSVQQSA